MTDKIIKLFSYISIYEKICSRKNIFTLS